MKQEKLVDRWIKALRSGDYEQDTGRLCYSGSAEKKYCCLGVLTLLFDPNHPSLEDGSMFLRDEIMEQLRDEEGWNAHPFLKYWNNGNLDLVYNDDGDTLSTTDMNDLRLFSFDEIADALERTFRSGGRKDCVKHTWTRGDRE